MGLINKVDMVCLSPVGYGGQPVYVEFFIYYAKVFRFVMEY